MKISLDEIHKAFDDLIKEKRPREEIASWAEESLRAHDNNMLVFMPVEKKDKIWMGIKYLTGVDLKDSPNSYLHSIENFIKYRKENDF